MAAAFLRIPPFPGHRAPPLAVPGQTVVDGAACLALLRQARVGGAFWGESDPWRQASDTAEVQAGADSELALVAAILGKPLRLDGPGRFAGCDTDPAGVLARELGAWQYRDPFSGEVISAEAAIALLAEWRALIDANRPVRAVLGVAQWKRVTLDPLLWDGTGRVRHARGLPADMQGPVIAWKSRTSAATLRQIEASGAAVAELEDGMIRSPGLGANCVPPLSAIVDFRGVYFDPAGPSDLEHLLQSAEIGPDLLERAARLREHLVREAVSKYGAGGAAIERPAAHGRRVLVTGQVEDDRSIISGGGGYTNLQLLVRAREMEPPAWIVYKPHPDVEAGHRVGHIPEEQALAHANEIQRHAPITALIDSVDALHVITSLAGFEALLRGKAVTTHGMPFYAGWGLTHDLAPVPPRRTRRRSLDELVAATLLLYPRYCDPVTRLPCPAEVVVRRMAEGTANVSSPLIALREWQGRIRLALRRIGGG